MDGDSVCTANDILPMGADTVWVWLDTNHDAAGKRDLVPDGPSTHDERIRCDDRAQLIPDGWACIGSGGRGNLGEPNAAIRDRRWASFIVAIPVGACRLQIDRTADVYPPGSLPARRASHRGSEPRLQRGSNQLGGAGGIALSDWIRVAVRRERRGDYTMTLNTDFEESCAATSSCLGLAPTTWGSIKSRYR